MRSRVRATVGVTTTIAVAVAVAFAPIAHSAPKELSDGRSTVHPATVLVPHLATGWKYLQTGHDQQPGFESTTYDDSAWATGQAAFGSTNGVCPWNNPNFVKTTWDLNTDMLLRRHIAIPTGMGIHIQGAVDNTARVYVNGVQVTESYGGNCKGGAINVDVPPSALTPDTVLAIRGIDVGHADYLDLQVTTTKCNPANTGVDAGRGVSAQNMVDLGYWTHAADDFSCQGPGRVHVRTFSFDGRYSAGSGPVDKFLVIIRHSDPTGTLIEPTDEPEGVVCHYLKPYTVKGSGPVYTFVVKVPKNKACTLSPDTTYWLVVQAQMPSTVGSWQWELQSGPPIGNDADWKTNNPDFGPGTCDTYSQTGGVNPGGDRDLEDCLHLGEAGAPDLLFTVS